MDNANNHNHGGAMRGKHQQGARLEGDNGHLAAFEQQMQSLRMQDPLAGTKHPGPLPHDHYIHQPVSHQNEQRYLPPHQYLPPGYAAHPHQRLLLEQPQRNILPPGLYGFQHQQAVALQGSHQAPPPPPHQQPYSGAGYRPHQHPQPHQHPYPQYRPQQMPGTPAPPPSQPLATAGQGLSSGGGQPLDGSALLRMLQGGGFDTGQDGQRTVGAPPPGSQRQHEQQEPGQGSGQEWGLWGGGTMWTMPKTVGEGGASGAGPHWSAQQLPFYALPHGALPQPPPPRPPMGFPGGHQPLPFYRPPEEAGPPGFPPEPTLPGWDLQQNKSHKPHMPPGSPGSDVLQALELVAPGAAQQAPLPPQPPQAHAQQQEPKGKAPLPLPPPQGSGMQQQGSNQRRHSRGGGHPRYMESRDAITAALKDLVQQLEPLVEEVANQKKCFAEVVQKLTGEWPHCRVHLFGSCANTLSLCKNNDLDMSIELLEVRDDKKRTVEVVERMQELMKASGMKDVVALTHARVPVLKFVHPVTDTKCDITVNNELACINTKLLRDYASLDPRVRELVFVVKHWAKRREVNEAYQGTLSSYAYVLMCIHLLQNREPPILPCLQAMKPATYRRSVREHCCDYFDDLSQLEGHGKGNADTLADLVWAFFEYWAWRHDYNNSVISIRTAGFLSKADKGWTKRVGTERHLICIEDPFVVTHDLGRVVDRNTITVLRKEFERAAQILRDNANPLPQLFEPYQNSSK